jgi:hypothetical protein
MCKNSLSYTQSAGNLYALGLTSSSETTRGSSFNFARFNAQYTQQTGRGPVDVTWLTWFVGFSEGDGAILRSSGYPQFVITQKEVEILIHIQAVLGFGSVRTYYGYSRFVVGDKKNIALLYDLFNGNLVLPHRQSQLTFWSTILSLNIVSPILPLILPSLNDAWLSGFTDAEGCFNAIVSPRSNSVTGFRVILRFLLDQKNAEPTLLYIRNLFSFGSVALRGTTNGVYRYTCGSYIGLVSVRDYFLSFPLKTKKSLSFTKWNSIYTMVLNKEHLTQPGLDIIRGISKEINKSVTNKTGSAKP